MWYAIMFVSFMNLSMLTLDLENEYSSYKECMNETKEGANELFMAMNEQLRPQEKLLTPPRVSYNCKKIPLRKA